MMRLKKAMMLIQLLQTESGRVKYQGNHLCYAIFTNEAFCFTLSTTV